MRYSSVRTSITGQYRRRSSYLLGFKVKNGDLVAEAMIRGERKTAPISLDQAINLQRAVRESRGTSVRFL